VDMSCTFVGGSRIHYRACEMKMCNKRQLRVQGQGRERERAREDEKKSRERIQEARLCYKIMCPGGNICAC
jgi:hypothetical protein